jgi:Protein of unknown function (DUF1186)
MNSCLRKSTTVESAAHCCRVPEIAPGKVLQHRINHSYRWKGGAMDIYAEPVSSLLMLGRPVSSLEDSDYTRHGITAEHIPDLIRLLSDDNPMWDNPDVERPEWYAHIHAWRALGQLRAEQAIEPLLSFLADEDDDELSSDWVMEEVPATLGRIGPAAIPATVACLNERGMREWGPICYAKALTEIAKQHPSVRSEVIGHLTKALETAAANDMTFNGFVVADLLKLKAVEAWPAIEAAFATKNVDEFIIGDAAKVKYRLGLGPPPDQRVPSGRVAPAQPSNAKQRFNDRMAKKKAAKKKRKQERKRK